MYFNRLPSMFGLSWTKASNLFMVLAMLCSMVGAGVTPVLAQPPNQVDSPLAAGWTAYNDCVYRSSDQYIGTNVTTFGIGNNFTGSTSGTLLDQATGDTTGVTATLTQSGTVVWQPDPVNGGADTAAGTDAYNTFHNLADMTGVIYYGSTGWYVDLTFTGLDPAKTYTFATSATRGDATYTDRLSKYTLSGHDAATNASSTGSGMTIINNYSVAFNTGDNYSTGYIAKWTEIEPGSDGSFKIRAEAYNSSTQNKAYAFDVFMLHEEPGETPVQYTLSVNTVGKGNVTLSPSGGTYNENTVVTLTPTPYTGESFTGWSGTDTADLVDNLNGTWNITMNAAKSLTATFTDTAPTPQALPILEGDTWTYYKGTSEPPSGWVNIAFDDASWLPGASGFGYSDSDDNTTLSDMQNSYLSVYARKLFTVSNPGDMYGLQFAIDYDDGFVAYLNGVEIARDNITGTPPAYNTAASTDHEASGGDSSPQPIKYYTVNPALLVTGTNVLAVQGHNKSLSSSDFSLIPELTETEPPACYALTLGHSGNGATPTASPTNSSICSAGEYIAGETIALSGAVADSGWQIDSWYGTTANTSTANTNTVTMPASTHSAGINYAEQPPEVTVTFREGVDSYSGTQDTFIRGTTAGASNFGSDAGLEWDENTGTTTDEITLIRFNDIFTSEGGLIPDGATITTATLSYMTTDLSGSSTAEGDPANVYESLVDWAESTVTYNNFGGDVGVQTDEYNATLIDSAIAEAISTVYSIDVTSSLQSWSANPAGNLGWIFLPTNSDGVTVYSSEATTVAYRPILSVTYMTQATNHAPDAPVLVQPLDDATGISTSPTLEVTVSDVDLDDLDVEYYGREVGGVTGEDFTLIILPDTQNMSTSYPAAFNSMTQWIVDNQDDKNIVFVTHVGDIVNTSTSTVEWGRADTAMDILDDGNVPYSVGPGNHDLGGLYNTYFGPDRFVGNGYYQSPYTAGQNENNYSFFSTSGNDFILINLQYSPTSAHLDWADALLKANPNRRGIVAQHDILKTDDTWQNQASYTALKDNPNLFLMVCGHMHTTTDGSAYRAELGDDGHTIHILLTDFQDYTSGGNGWLRILNFSPADDKIYASIYSPYTGGFLTSESNFEQFEMVYDLSGSSGASFTLLDTVNDVVSGANASINLAGLLNDTEYEWYVKVSDGSTSVTSDIWSFTTAPALTCYPLTLSHTGQGSDPVATPANSTGCPAGQYVAAETISLTGASADTGWHISGWTGTANDTSTENTNSLSMPASAHAASVTYEKDSVTLTVTPTGSGTVEQDPVGPYLYGDAVELTAVPATGWQFVGWTGDLTGSTNPETITLNGNKSVTAVFTQIEYDLETITSGSGSITKNPDQTTYHYNDIVTLTAIPATGWVFSGWSGDASGATNPIQVTITANTSVTATFTQLCYTLTTSVDPAASGSISASVPPNCNGETQYTHGTVISLTANAATGYGFDHWSGALTGTTNPQSITMDADKSVTAVFALNAVSLVVNVTGSGLVTQTPEGPYQIDDVVQLTAVPATGWHFVEWTGSLTGSASPASITLDENKTVMAVFARDTVTLTVTPSGSGTVTQDPVEPYLYGDVVELTAVPATGWHLVEWTGDQTGSTNPVEITLDGSKNVTAVFARDSVTLTVIPDGSGTVTQNPLGPYLYGDVVALTAVPATGWHFVGWSGSLTSTENPVDITLNGAKIVTAIFARDAVTLTVTPSGSGTVTQNPAGPYLYGDVVELTAVPATGWHFVEWTGNLTGSTSPESVTLDGSKSVTAVFTRDTVTLTVTPNGSGTVTQNPAGPYLYGDVVELTAVPATDWEFDKWTGDLSGSDNPETITLDGNKTVTAVFTEESTMICETFDSFTPGSNIGDYTGWYDGGSGPVVTAGNGVAGSIGLANANPIFTWAAQPFDWTDPTFVGVKLQADFQTDASGHFDDDRVGWMIADNSVNSDYQFGVQLDPGGSGYNIEAYWDGNTLGDDGGRSSITDLPTLSPSTWYRFYVYVSKLTATSARIDVSLTQLDASGQPGSVVASGSILDTDLLPNTANQEIPNEAYFTGPIYPAYKNYNAISGAVDNVCYEVVSGTPPPEYTLTVNTVGNGSVTLNPAGGTYYEDTVVELTAVADIGWGFTSWSGDITDTTNPIQVTMDADKTITATFTQLPPVNLTVNVTGNGSVTLNPSGGVYDVGTTVQLTAVPDSNWSFNGWSGSLTGSTNPASITMTANMTVTAAFTELPPTPTGTCTDFETGYTVGQVIGTHAEWFDSGSGPVVTSSAGLAGSIGLAPGSSIFTWSEYPFNWNDPSFGSITLNMDFQTNASGQFDDDRMGWMTTDSNATSTYFFGVQLDHTDGGIVTYWRDSDETRIQTPIVELSALAASAWYRLTTVITKIDDTSAQIDVSLVALDASGNPTGTTYSGSVSDTSTWADGAPNLDYFTATSMWPAYKNHSAIQGGADNACFDIISGRFAFVVTSDWHTSDTYPNADISRRTQQIAAWIDNPTSSMPAPEFMVITGDFPNLSQTQEIINTELGSDFLWYPVIGNHEVSDNINNFYEIRDTLVPTLPNIVNYGPTGSVNTTYSVDYENAHLVMINPFWDGASNDATSGGDIPTALNTWVNNDLAAYGSTHNFVFIHTPPFPANRHVGEDLDANPTNRDAFIATLNANSVESIFSGHTHYYEHDVVPEYALGSIHQITNGSLRNGGVPVTITYVLVEGSTTTYKVFAESGTTFSLYDEWSIGGSGPSQPPAAPTTLTADAISYAHINLSWTDNADNEASFEIERSTTGSSGTFNPLSSVLSNVETYSDYGLSEQSEYCYRVRAVNAAGQSAYSNVACDSTPERPPVVGVCEDFEVGFAGSTVGTHADWYDGGSGPVATTGQGLLSSVGLAPAANIFSWTAQPFTWSDPAFQGINLQMDFQTNASGQFDDDRMGWTTNSSSTDSAYNFGIQLDHSDGGIVTYWRNSSNTRIQTPIVTLPTLAASTWYRLRAEITKLTDTSAMIDVSLVQLDASGSPTGTTYAGTLPNTSTWADGAPATSYFTAATMWPLYKNYNAIVGAADNACYEVISGLNTVIMDKPANPSFTADATFTFNSSEPTATFECKLDAAAFATCTSPKQYLGLTDGSHTFQVRAVTATEVDLTPAEYTWAINTASSDDFDHPIIIPNTPNTHQQDTSTATTAADDPMFTGCAERQGFHTVWYLYTPATSGTLTANTHGSGFDTLLGIWTGTRGSLNMVGCNDDDPWPESALSVSVTAGRTYYIEVAGYHDEAFGTLVLNVDGPSPSVSCYGLTLSHTGQGEDPVASPLNSIGCPAGEYLAGAEISLSDATPDSGWQIDSWTGTNNNQSQLSTNTVTMPASAHTASVNYVETSIFADVPLDYTVTYGGVDYRLYPYIKALYDAGYTSGCSSDPLMFCPANNLTRAEAAVFMLRAVAGVDYSPTVPTPPRFTDDDFSGGNIWAQAWVESMYTEGLSSGVSDTWYNAWAQLARDEASVFALRIKHGSTYSVGPANGTIFADLTDTSYWGTAWAEQAYLEGLLPACGWDEGKPMICATDNVSRALAAYMIVLAKDIELPE